MCWRRRPTETSDRAVRERDRILLGSAHAVPETVCSASACRIPRRKWCIWNPMPVQDLDARMRVSAWGVGPLLFAPWNWYKTLSLWQTRIPIESVQPCTHIYSKYWRITGASNTFATCPWSKHGIHIQQHFQKSAIKQSNLIRNWVYGN